MSLTKRLLEEQEARYTKRYKCPEREIEPDVEGCGEYEFHTEHDGYAECFDCGVQITTKEEIEKIWEEDDYDGHFSHDEIATRGW